MFANPIRIEIDGFGVTLRPLRKNEMEHIAELFASMEVLRYTNMVYAPTVQGEEEWWEKASKEPNTAIWGIVPDGEDTAVGVTGLHQINAINLSCTSGIIIGDRKWWHKGVAYRAHLARTWYAANTLNRYTIQSQVRTKNAYSLKALLKVGYRVSGRFDCNCFHDGVFCDTWVLSWVNPYKVNVLYPNGVPKELQPSLDKAKQALNFAPQAVKFL
ncbi:GNAT family N-acetyltransferase [candidate division WWE3 bacterium]|uniref:GNAT family N-acetyltransferase n=1 Tax=candidate division WWE3 bacterium TaxID=2053526 RepID=A0A7X9HGP1_UNCKA|nr:GNAT family N-acetyltransferase [candidate division WWE3 bacterium]